MNYWKSKVVPKIKKLFEKSSAKKAAAAEACKSFDDSKEEINKEFEEKNAELHPKVLVIYEACSAEIKTLIKGPTDDGVKKHSVAVTKFLEELVKIEFPGSKTTSEISSKFGPALVSGPVFFIFQKVSTYLPAEEAVAPAAEETSTKEKEVVVDEVNAPEVEIPPTENPPAETSTTVIEAVEEPAKDPVAPKP